MRLYEYGMQHRVDTRVERRNDPRHDRRAESGRHERELGTPIEREHETYAGIFEEDERRQQSHRTSLA
jgi:hypothetical protein